MPKGNFFKFNNIIKSINVAASLIIFGILGVLGVYKYKDGIFGRINYLKDQILLLMSIKVNID